MENATENPNEARRRRRAAAGSMDRLTARIAAALDRDPRFYGEFRVRFVDGRMCDTLHIEKTEKL